MQFLISLAVTLVWFCMGIIGSAVTLGGTVVLMGALGAGYGSAVQKQRGAPWSKVLSTAVKDGLTKLALQVMPAMLRSAAPTLMAPPPAPLTADPSPLKRRRVIVPLQSIREDAPVVAAAPLTGTGAE